MPSSRRVIKGHLKREDGVQSLVKRSLSYIHKKLDEFEVEGQTPPQLSHIIQPMMDKMTRLKTEVLQGQDGIKKVLEGMSEEKLKAIQKVFSKKGNGCHTEDKLLQSSFIALDELNQLDVFINHFHKTKRDIIDIYIELYANSYTLEKGGDVVFNNEAFINDVNSVLSFRNGLRRAMEAHNNNNGGAELINPEDANRCVLM